MPVQAINKPLDIERIITQLKKTSNTQFEFNDINVQLDPNLFIPNISIINELRRQALANIETTAIEKFKRNIDIKYSPANSVAPQITQKGISVCFNILDDTLDYTKLNNFSNAYIPLKYFYNNKYFEIINTIAKKADIYVYMPIIIRGNYKNMATN